MLQSIYQSIYKETGKEKQIPKRDYILHVQYFAKLCTSKVILKFSSWL